MYCNVLITKPFNHAFTYRIKKNQNVKIGNIVLVPFGNKNKQLGMVCEVINNLDLKIKKIKIKEIEHVFNNLLLGRKIIEFIEWISDYTLAPKGLVLKLFLVNDKIINFELQDQYNEVLHHDTKNFYLNKEQKKAFEIINNYLISEYKAIVLEGVTGSGKTEVYFEAIKKMILLKKQVLILLPEISLTPQLEERFSNSFGFLPDVWHSKVAYKNKKITWQKCLRGKPVVVLGARSALFLPFTSLGLIVVDEEHDLSFKQEDNIRYQARDLAIVRAKIEKFPIVLSSATPSLETQNNIKKKKFIHLFLPNQYSGLELPRIELVDLTVEKIEKSNWMSNKIIEELKKRIKHKEQSLLFLNRRGYSPLTICKSCGHRYQCNQCASWLVLHKQKNRMLCHHCGSIYPVSSCCPICNTDNSLKLIGPGVERLAEELKSLFPEKNISIMSSDNANTPNKIKKIIKDFESKKIDILVATQIMSKGYHFPNLSFVGVIDADAGLLGGDIRATERTYNLLQQVSGRAGRANKIGKVLIQTYYPNQPVIQSFKNRDRDSFITQSLIERKKFNVPPFGFITAIIISASKKVIAEAYAFKFVNSIFSDSNIEVLGPVEAPLFLLRGKYRYRLLLKGNNRKKLNFFTKNIIKKCPPPSNIRITIDVDPYTFT